MDEFEKIQRLIRLKKYEKPGDGFIDEFQAKFRERQRGEMLRQSALGLVWERLQLYCDQVFSPRWALAAAVIVVGLIAGWLLMPRSPVAGIAKMDAGRPAVTVTLASDPSGRKMPAFSIDTIRIMGEIEIEPDPGLLSKHFSGGYEQFVIVPHDKSESTIAVPYDLIRLDGKPDIR